MCQTSHLKFISGLFEACWFIHVYVSHQARGCGGKEATRTLLPAWARISPDTGIKEWATVPLCGFWRASRRQIIQGTRPTGDKGMGKCAVLYSSQISCSPHLRLPQASSLRLVWLNMGKARWGSDKQDYMLFAPGCHNYSVVDRGGVNWDEEQTEVSVK